MDQKLTRCFISLKEETDAAQRGALADVTEVINDISRFCEDLVTDQDVSLALAAVFDPATGILSTVERLLLCRDRSIQKGRESCLTFLADFLKRTSMRAAPYASFVKERCVSIFQREESKSGQAAALLPLISLLDLFMQQHVSLNFSLDWTTAKVFLLEYRKAKSSGTLRSNILILLGNMVECFPSSFEENDVIAILNLCLNGLDEQLRQKGKDPLYVLVAGAMKCLDGLLTWFNVTSPAGGTVENARRVYAYLEQVIYIREDLKRYEMVKAGLRLLSRHACLFRIRLLEDSLVILNWLEAYCTHVNAQLRDAALPAFNEFILQISICLASEDSRIKNGQEMYKKLIAHALGILDAQGKSSKLVSLAIRMVGKLSPLIMKFSGKDVLQQAFQRIVSFGMNSQRLTEIQEESMGLSVTLVGAFSDMIVNLDDVDNYMVTVVAEAVGKIFYGFPYLFPKQKPLVYTTIQDLFKSLHQKGAIFSVFLENIVWSSLERAMESIQGNQGGLGTELWKNYAELWSKLLDLQDTVQYRDHKSKGEESLEDTSLVAISAVGNRGAGVAAELQETIFDALIKCIMKALKELNLKYRVKRENPANKISSEPTEDAEIAGLDPDSDKDPIEPLNDMHMKKFLNLVEFAQELLLSHIETLFQKWVYPFGRCLVELSSCYPLLSGFYKLLTVTIKIADDQGCFKNADAVGESDCTININTVRSRLPEEERTLCCNLLHRYLQEVLIASRRYKLELLASCLRLCLSAPPALIGITSLVEPIKVALKMGLRYNPLADIAMDALERWLLFSQSELEPYLAQIVPCFNNYLYMRMDVSETDPQSPHQTSTLGLSNENLSSSQLRQIKKDRTEVAQV